MQQISLLIFDLDGTLVNTLEDITASVNFTLQKLGRKPVPLDTVRQYVGDGIEMLMTRALAGSDEFLPDAVGIYKVHHSRNLVVRSSLYPAVRETLEFFKELPLALVSNKTREFVEPLLARLGIADYFTSIIGADDGLPLKPAPDAILKIMAAAGASKERTVMVGDGTTDVLAGKAAGVVTCAVTYGFRAEEELRKTGPDYVIREFSELVELFTPAMHEPDAKIHGERSI